MKNLNYNLSYIVQHIKVLTVALVAGSMTLLLAGCGEVQDSTAQNTVQLPTDSALNFACADEGIYLEKCVLDNPENPYANVAINAIEDSPNNKFALNDAAPSAKAKYYLWASALAKGAGIPGENQYYTALSLHQVFAESGSPTTREQALKAYRSVLDNYFLNPTFFVFPVNGENVAIAAPLKDLVGGNLYNPTNENLVSFYADPALALQEMSVWGYIYNTTTKTMSLFR